MSSKVTNTLPINIMLSYASSIRKYIYWLNIYLYSINFTIKSVWSDCLNFQSVFLFYSNLYGIDDNSLGLLTANVFHRIRSFVLFELKKHELVHLSFIFPCLLQFTAPRHFVMKDSATISLDSSNKIKILSTLQLLHHWTLSDDANIFWYPGSVCIFSCICHS